MKYRNAIITIGFFNIVIQFLGFPESWKNGIYALVGLAVITLAYVGKEK